MQVDQGLHLLAVVAGYSARVPQDKVQQLGNRPCDGRGEEDEHPHQGAHERGEMQLPRAREHSHWEHLAQEHHQHH